jgi:hypothetical protein
MDRSALPLEPRHLGEQSDVIQNDFYVWRKPCTYLALTLTPSLNGPKWDLTWPTLPRGSIGFVRNDFPSLWYVQRKPCTYHASRLALSLNGPKRVPLEPRHLEYHRVRPKWFLSLCYVQHKPCTYLELILALSQSGTKWDLTWPISHRSSIGCV